MVGADTCGFGARAFIWSFQYLTLNLPFHFIGGNANEELCNRWMQLAAFTPFFRNHNIRGAISQEPYRWDSVAHASRAAIAVRYALLPYWVRPFPCLLDSFKLLPQSC